MYQGTVELTVCYFSFCHKRVNTIMSCITCFYIALVVAISIPAMGQEVPMYNDTLWHINAREQLYPFNGFSNGLGYAPVTNTLYSGTEVGLIALYDAETGVLKDTILLAHKRIHGLDVSADGTRIYVYVQDSAAKGYVDRAKGQVIEYPSKRIIVDSVPMGYIWAKISPDGRYVATGTNSVYDIQTELVLSEEGTSLQGVSHAFALGGSRVIGCHSTTNEQFRFRLFDYKNQRMEVDTGLGKAGFGLQARTHGNKVAILTHTYMWILTVYSLPSMEKIWTTYFTESDGFGFFDFLDDEHIICRTEDQKYGLGTWIYKIGTNDVGSTRPAGQTIGIGKTPGVTSRDGRFLFAAEGVLLSVVDLRGFTSGVSDLPKDDQEALIYPNPTNSTFTVQLAGCNSCEVSWEMINISGETSAAGGGISDENGSMTSRLPLSKNGSALSPGRYTLRMQSGARAWSFILVVL